MMTSQKGRLGAFWRFLFKKETDLRPETEIPVIKTDLSKISKDENVLVWFGHSSYFIQVDGKRILVDPVFCVASPVSFVNKPFKGVCPKLSAYEIYPYHAPIFGTSGQRLECGKDSDCPSFQICFGKTPLGRTVEECHESEREKLFERVDAYYRGSGPVKIMNDIDYLAIDELLTEIYIPIENKSKIICWNYPKLSP